MSLLNLSSVLFIMIECPLFQPWLGSYCSEDRGHFYHSGFAEHSILNKGGHNIVPCNGPESSLDCRHSLDTSDVERVLKIIKLANNIIYHLKCEVMEYVTVYTM